MAKQKVQKELTTADADKQVGTSPNLSHPLNVNPVELHAKTVLHRVHPAQYAATQFNPGPNGNARFSPIQDSAGKSIPTIYAGETFECAAMETVFHDVSYEQGPKIYPKDRLKEHTHSTVETSQALLLADLGTKSLRKLGIQRKDLIETEKSEYPFTRKVAEAIHAQHYKIQGLRWTSRQDDSAYAYVLFGDRLDPATLNQIGQSRSLTNDPEAYDEILDLAKQIGVDVVTF